MITVVFGAWGSIGRHVAAGLTASGVPVRLTSRTPDASHVAADLEVPETLPAAGRRIPIEVVTPEQARADLGRAMPAMGVEAIMRAWTAGAEAVPETSVIVGKLTGRPAQTFAEWAREHAADFR
ncbi:hypothetical protein AB0C27_46845 [Nonomuraea sp. NPDC048882]|uniref:hypothetical protein n=1 Tax=Nonomuraea sp. NPDC048882 TaxID=3154347 RepID=UPI000A9650A3